MELHDLNDGVGADDWLIPRQELTERQLLRQTACYTIYKADWFGDVLVYVPNQRPSRGKPLEGNRQELALRRQQTKQQQDTSEQENLKQRLSELCLNFNGSNFNRNDSAYSSISSSPQYHQNQQHEFAFPIQQQFDVCSLDDDSRSMSSIASSADEDERVVSTIHLETDVAISPPVILNKNSFNFKNNDIVGSDKEESTSNKWFELNELRLVAHENFILFMGASMDAHSDLYGSACNDGQNTSLVMEMIKPKSVSLFNLLHANKSQTTSPHLNRFFGQTPCRQSSSLAQSQLLSVADKLNICQQVTNAMTYLHDKNIVHGRLTSVNIYIEPNQQVKISLIDNDEQTLVNERAHGKDVALNLPTLTYLSPELVKTLRVTRPTQVNITSCDKCLQAAPLEDQLNAGGIQMDLSLLTKQADIYSFGTLLYEIFEGKFPFALDNELLEGQTNWLPARRSPSPTQLNTNKLFDTLCLASHKPTSSLFKPRKLGTPISPLCARLNSEHWCSNIKLSASELIFQIGSGQMNQRNRHRVGCPALVDQIITACWSSEPSKRPSFRDMKFD